MTLADLSPLANHLWQSTFFALAVWVLTLALRKNRAAVRYWLWLAASVKFLIPFSVLVRAGALVKWHAAAASAPVRIPLVMEQISQPFEIVNQAPSLAVAAPAPNLAAAILLGIWLCGVVVGIIFWMRWQRRISVIVRGARPLDLKLPIRVMSSPARLEPGVVGILNPVLLLPDGIADRLTPAQLEAVLSHELRHVCRRDNLTAAIHMVVEVSFWFHPLVWWIRRQLVAERERACDEEVVQAAGDPQVYAEGILNVCKFYVESPLCVSGITGADLKKRIEEIMARRVGHNLAFGKKLLLAALGIAAIGGPVVIGLLHMPRIHAETEAQEVAQQELDRDAAQPTFDVASIKRDVSAGPMNYVRPFPSFHAERLTLKALILLAYHVHGFQVTGGPGWIGSDRYNIDAKAEPHATPDQQFVALQKRRLQTLLRDRFHLAIHRETKELPIYEMSVAKGGPKLQPSTCLQRVTGDTAVAPGKTDSDYCGGTEIGRDRIQGAGVSMAFLSDLLSSRLSRTVVDKTGITGEFQIQLTYTPEASAVLPLGAARPGSGDGAAATDPGPDIFTAIREQLGLRLESGKGPVEVVVIDHVERPSEN